MLRPSHTERHKAEEIAGGVASITEQLGAPDLASLVPMEHAFHCNNVSHVNDLPAFLQRYAAEVMAERDFATIVRAYEHASRFEVSELLALDARLGEVPLPPDLARASRTIGRTQLRKLWPLRDQRLVQRYLAAVDNGEAQAWHTVVFGVVLAMFSIPLRQGLMHYAQRTLHGFIQSNPFQRELSEDARADVLANCASWLPALVDKSLRNEHGRSIRPVA